MTFLRPRAALLVGALVFPVGAHAQQAQPSDQPVTNQAATPNTDEPGTQAGDEEGDEEEIVVTGQRARGSVIGDIPPEKSLSSRDIRATGATSISDLLDALAPEIGSARGRGAGAPVLLLNGQRISSFRELRDIPPEAIQRVDILPEEVALKYGYRADQRVVNIVLRRRFRSTAVQLTGNGAPEAGYYGGSGDVTRLHLGSNGRTTFNLHAEGNGLLSQSAAGAALQQGPSQGSTDASGTGSSQIASTQMIRGSTVLNRTVLGNVSATLNLEAQHNEGRTLLGLSDTLEEPQKRKSTSDSAHAGLTLNGDKAGWHWNVTGNADVDHDVTGLAGDAETGDRTKATNTSANLTGTANGTLFKLPAGNATTTLTLSGSTVHLDSERDHEGIESSNSLGRTTGQASINLDLPISRTKRDFGALGNLTLNANAELDQLSDFGTLTTIGAGLNWTPVQRLNLVTSWTREEGAPIIQQLGNPVLETPTARVFDFVTGEVVRVNAITGGNPDLEVDRRNVIKLGANWQPFDKTDLRFRADYVHSVIDHPIENIFGPTPALEEAFPDRFVRDSEGNLVSADLRPLNFDQARRDTLRVGFDFSKPLKSRRPSQNFINQVRQRMAAAGIQAPSGDPGAGSPDGGRPGAGSGRGGRGFGGFFGGNQRGRLQFSLTDTITFVDKVSIGPGLPDLDYLHGDVSGPAGGTPRHNVQARAGWSNNGLGARLSANWRSGTTVDGFNGNDLRFSPLATFDLRLFANFGDQFELVAKHPFLRGASLQLGVKNMFDERPKVRDAAGNTPANYRPDLLDPLGRTFMITFRKLFLPPPRFVRQLEREQSQPPQSR